MLFDLKSKTQKDFCCKEMELQWNVGNIGTDTVNVCVMYYMPDTWPREEEGYMDIFYCPWCGEKIEVINAFKQD